MKIEKNRRIRDVPAFLFSLMLWRALPAKVVALFAGSRGESLAMGMVVVFCVVVYIWHVFARMHGKLPGGRAMLVPFSGVAILGASVLLHPNEWNTLYLTYFIRYVFFTLIFLLSVKDYSYLVETFYRFSFVAFVILGWQPMISSNVFTSWMDYGFAIALPCTIGLYCLAKSNGKIIYWAAMVTSFFLAIAFANRSTWLCILFFIALYKVTIENKTLTLKKFVFIYLALAAIVLTVYNFEAILDWLIMLNEHFDYNSHSLLKIKQLLNGTTLDVFTSGRQGLSNMAIDQIGDSFPFGAGVGTFEVSNGVYSHNIILDLLLYWGIFGVFFGGIALVGVFRSALREKDASLKTLKIILLCMWFPKLLFSGSFTYEIPLWSGIALFVLEVSTRQKKGILKGGKNNG